MSHVYIDRSNYFQQKEHERQQERHKKRLEEIANRKVKVKINPEVEHNLRMNENKRLIHKFQVNKKTELIDKDNQNLLQRLIEIQSGKREQRAKSLHLIKRRLEAERIERENLKIAQKIYDLKPQVRIEELEEDYIQHKKYSLGLRKLRKKKIPQHQGKPGTLPPLDEESAKKEKKMNNRISQSMEAKSGEALVDNEQESPDQQHEAITVNESRIEGDEGQSPEKEIGEVKPEVRKESAKDFKEASIELSQRPQKHKREQKSKDGHKEFNPYMAQPKAKTNRSVKEKFKKSQRKTPSESKTSPGKKESGNVKLEEHSVEDQIEVEKQAEQENNGAEGNQK